MLAHQASQQRKELSLVQQLALGLDCLKMRLTPLPEPFSDCILLLSVSTPGETAATFYVRRSTLEAAWRAGTTQVRQWAWSRSLDCLELRVDWPTQIAALEGLSGSAQQPHSASAWAIADENLETVALLPPQRWQPATSACAALNVDLAQRAGSTGRAHWLLHLQGLFVDSEGGMTHLPRTHPDADADAAADAQAGLVVLQALAAPEQAKGCWSSERLQALCARLYALLLVQQRLSHGAAAQRGLAQLLGRAAQQLCQQIEQPPPQAPQAQALNQALCLLVLARYAQAQQTQQAELADGVRPVLAQLARQSRGRQGSPLQPIARPDAAAAWHIVAQAAYADSQSAGASTPASAAQHGASHQELAAQDLAPLEAITRQWLQWHLLAHGGVPAPVPDWSVIIVAELALQPRLAGARSHLQSCSWLASLRQPLRASLRQRIQPETAMFLPPPHRANTPFMAPFVLPDPLQTRNWHTYQWIQRIFVPQLINF